MEKKSYGVQNFLVALALIFSFTVYKMFSYKNSLAEAREQAQIEAEITEQRRQQDQIREEEMREVERQRRIELLENLSDASEEQLRQIFRSCKSEVRSYMNRVNDGPFQPFLVDEYSADTYQAAAYFSDASIQSEGARVQEFLESRSRGDEVALDAYLNLSYAVIYTKDTFSGPTKEFRTHRCTLAPNLSIDRVF
jgi:hypothetical protein